MTARARERMRELLGKRFDLDLGDAVLDIRVTAIDPEHGIVTCRVFDAAPKRQQLVLTDVLSGIDEGLLVESDKP